MKKRNVLAVAFLLCLLLIPVAASLAYFTQAETAHSVITSGNVDIEVQEFTNEKDEEGNPLPFQNPVDVMPGQEVSKIVQVKNTGSGEAWIRIALLPEFKLSSDRQKERVIADPELVFLNINKEDWENSRDDGYLYYKHILKSGETTSPVFSSMTFSKDIGNEYQEGCFVLEVQAQAVQVRNNGENALTAVGWPAAQR